MTRRLRTSGMARVGSFVQSTLGSLGVQERVLEQKVVASWAEVVGPQIAAATNPQRIREGTLFVACKSSMWANELSLHKPQILKGLNAAAGKNVVTDIRFNARGFRRADSNSEQAPDKGEAPDIVLTTDDVMAAERVAAVCGSEELAVRVKQAMLAGKRLERLRAKESDSDG